MTSSVGHHIATVRHYDSASGVATVVVPALYGDVPVDARPFLATPAEVGNLPALSPGDSVIAFYDGGNPATILHWYRTGGAAYGEPEDVIVEANPQNALGVVAMGVMVAGVKPANTDTVIATIPSFTFHAGRRYRLIVHARANRAANCRIIYNFQRSGVNVGNYYWESVTGDWNGAVGGSYFDGDGATGPVTLSVNPASALEVAGAESSLLIEDVGPNAAPALPLPAVPQAWTPLTPLANGWTSFGAPHPPPALRRIGDMVQVRAAIKNATPMVNPSVSTFATLPVGFRPAYTINPPASGIGADNYGCPAIIVVDINGELKAVRNVTNVSPHIQTMFDFQFSVTA